MNSYLFHEDEITANELYCIRDSPKLHCLKLNPLLIDGRDLLILVDPKMYFTPKIYPNKTLAELDKTIE